MRDLPETRPSNATHDVLIFGGGLAGCILAERLLNSGRSVTVVDDPQKSRCSRVAAGIINPIGGKRLKRVWQAETLIPHALSYYLELGRKNSTRFFHPRLLARLFANADEELLWQKRLADPAYGQQTSPLASVQLPPAFNHHTAGFAIPESGYLDTNALLDSIASTLAQHGSLLSSAFNYEEIQPSENLIQFRELSAPIAIFAEGHLATKNPWFDFIPIKPAKGVIATIALKQPTRSSDLDSQPIIIKSKFIVPRHDGTYHVGSTYNWDDSSDEPDSDGIKELERFLNDHIGADTWEFLSIKAGVRPATAGGYPAVGPHPEYSHLYLFNGFGSKGALQIPYLAAALIEAIYNAKPLFAEVLPARFLTQSRERPKRWIATEIVRQRIGSLLQKGDAAIDATLGNGHDTLWLSRSVGAAGHVFAYDLQKQALEVSRQRLEKAGTTDRVTLVHSGHETILTTLPSQLHGKIAAIVFNLGFLPGGDSNLITQSETTLRALEASLSVLKPGGELSVTLYPTHAGGGDEAKAVLNWLQRLDPNRFQVEIVPHPENNPRSPHPVFITKLLEGQPRVSDRI